MRSLAQKLSQTILIIVLPLAVLAVLIFSKAIGTQATGEIALWHFDETSGTSALDSSGNGNTGTLINGPVWTTGKVGNALQFDGVDDYVDVGNGNSLQGAKTVEMWVYINPTTKQFSTIMGKDGWTGSVAFGWIIRTVNTGASYQITIGNGITAKSISFGDIRQAWHHIVFTYNGTTLTGYLDGVSKGFVEVPFLESEADFNIGRASVLNQSSSYFSGIIDEVKIYNRALTADEVFTEYQSYLPILSSQPTFSVASNDGFFLSFSDESKIVSLNINNNSFPLLAGVKGGFSLKEITNNNVITNITGTLTKNSDQSLTQRAQVNDIDFTLTYTPKDKYIEVYGIIQNKRNDDRALQLTYSLPINAVGWNWGDYIRAQRIINPSIHYENVYKIGDTRNQNVYPFSSIDNTIFGLSIAVPMDIPRIYRINYDTVSGYTIQYDFGLSPKTLKIGQGSASFKFIIYKNDEPSWGFRGATKKYYDIYPQFFMKKNKQEGTTMWIESANIKNIPNASDFGFEFLTPNLLYDPFSSLQYYANVNNLALFHYSEPWAWTRDFKSKPTYEEALSALHSDSKNIMESWQTMPLKQVAQGIINSAIYNSAGLLTTHDNANFWINDGYGWNLKYPINIDPDIPDPSMAMINYFLNYTNIILNRTKTSGYINNWFFRSDLTFKSISSVDSTEKHSGNYSAKMDIPGNTINDSGQWQSEEITVKPNTSYVFSAWAKTKNIGGNNPAIKVALIDTERNINWKYSSKKTLSFDFDNKDWIHKKTEFMTLDNTDKILIFANWNGYGTFWFDDLSLIEIGNNINLIKNNGFESNDRGNITELALNGLVFDSLFSDSKWAKLENYRNEYFKYSDNPLVFNYGTGKVNMLNIFSQYEYLDYIDKKNIPIMANIFPNAYNFYAHLLNVLGGEIFEIEKDENSSQRRTLSYQKTNSNILQWSHDSDLIDSFVVEKYLKKSLFYAIFPSLSRSNSYGKEGTYWTNTSLYERDRLLFKKYIPIIKIISAAGWEPVSYAISSNPLIKLERYGFLDKNNLYYTIRNDETSSQSGNIIINLNKFNISNTSFIQIKDMFTGIVTVLAVNNFQAIFPVALNSLDTLVFQVITGSAVVPTPTSIITPTPVPSFKIADLNSDGKVNAQDFAILMSAWNSIAKPKADINQDGLVDSLDFGLMMSFWG